MKAWRITVVVCAVVVLTSVLACVGMAIARSNGLVEVKVTALNPDDEPTDHNIPLVKRNEALPDYELTVITTGGRRHYLGVKPNESAGSGLTWKLADPVSMSQISTVRLREKDKMVSDALAEVNVTAPTVDANGYRFEFKTERSFGVGLSAFFTTPIGMAISIAFGIAVLVAILGGISF